MSRRPEVPEAQRGQAMVLVALMAILLFGIAALTVDGSLNYLDRRQLHAASDAAALSGASVVSAGKGTAQSVGMYYAFQNLGISWSGTCSGATDTCTWTQAGYTIKVSNTYTSPNTQVNPYDPASSVSVDISHNKVQSGFAGVLGVQSVAIASHSAATSQSGFNNFPFAVSSRLLAVQGNSDSTVFGAVLLRDCAGSGSGAFALQGGQNGGLYTNGGTHLVLGQSIDSSPSGAPYPGGNQTAQAIVAQDRSSSSCLGGAQNVNPLIYPNDAKDRVSFLTTDGNYNYEFGFNTGPAGCNNPTAQSFVANCEASPIGTNANWEDPCWTTSVLADVVTTTNYFDSNDNTVHTTGAGTAAGCQSGSSHEGSFAAANAINIPAFPDPVTLVNTLDTSHPIPRGIVAGISVPTPLSNGTYQFQSASEQNRVFTSYSGGSGANLKFGPGWYIFDGAFTVAPQTFECLKGLGTQVPTTAYQGCVFIFRNGASLDISGKGNALQCAEDGGTHTACAFEFTDGSGTNYGTMKMSQGADVALGPVPYFPSNAAGHCNGNGAPSVCMPIIYSLDKANCVTTGTLTCAVDIKQSGSTFNVAGTIYVPNGAYSSVANASPASGQVIADTIILQGGNSSGGSGIAYRSGVLAPVPGAPFLFE
ncbi:MAG: TadE/TadG family type IV pilus assembly protein [Candidatus Dormibacteria bacterium]